MLKRAMAFLIMQIPKVPPPRPPCESNTKIPKFDGNKTYRCSDTGAYFWRAK